VLILLSDRLDNPVFGWMAIGLLAVAFLLRFFKPKPPGDGKDD